MTLVPPFVDVPVLCAKCAHEHYLKGLPYDVAWRRRVPCERCGETP